MKSSASELGLSQTWFCNQKNHHDTIEGNPSKVYHDNNTCYSYLFKYIHVTIPSKYLDATNMSQTHLSHFSTFACVQVETF